HDGAREYAGEAFTDHLPDTGDQVSLPRGGQHEGTGDAKAGHFVGQLTQRAGAEDHPHRRALVDEVLHGCSFAEETAPDCFRSRTFRIDTPLQEAGCATLRKPAVSSRLFDGAFAGRWASRMIAPAAIAAAPIDRNIGIGLW